MEGTDELEVNMIFCNIHQRYLGTFMQVRFIFCNKRAKTAIKQHYMLLDKIQ